MNKHIAVIFVILISLMSTTLFAQSSGINDNINSDILELSTKISPKQEKSSATFSIGAGYAVNILKAVKPGGIDFQLDLIFPVTTYLAINGSINIARFSGYKTSDGDYIKSHGGQTNIALSPGISFGNFRKKDKLNYFVNVGFAIGFGTTGEYTVTRISNGEILNHDNGGGLLDLIGIITSGRVSYKLNQQFQVYIEPFSYILTRDDPDSAGSNFHINGGISLNL